MKSEEEESAELMYCRQAKKLAQTIIQKCMLLLHLLAYQFWIQVLPFTTQQQQTHTVRAHRTLTH